VGTAIDPSVEAAESVKSVPSDVSPSPPGQSVTEWNTNQRQEWKKGRSAGGIDGVLQREPSGKATPNVSHADHGVLPCFSRPAGAHELVFPAFSPDGTQVAYWYARDGDFLNQNDVYVVPATGGTPRNLTRAHDRAIFRASWMPDGKTVLVAGNDVERTSLWLQTLEGPARRLETAS
jgi:Tol biopolymer transport system component